MKKVFFFKMEAATAQTEGAPTATAMQDAGAHGVIITLETHENAHFSFGIDPHADPPPQVGLVLAKPDKTVPCASIGICLTPIEYESYSLTVQTLSSGTHRHPDTSIFEQLEFHLFASNPFGLPAGSKGRVVFTPYSGAEKYEGSLYDLGYCFNTSMDLMCVSIQFDVDVEDSSSRKRSRSKLELVVNANGDEIGRDATMKLLTTWLDDNNRKFAPTYGVEKLVWCEESRARAGTRSFFRVDMTDNKKRKPCGNASAAIKFMQEFTKTDFYDDMRQKS